MAGSPTRNSDGGGSGQTRLFPAVVVHGLADAQAALAAGDPVTLLSSPGAALFAGCLWWRDLVACARASHPATPTIDILDCADGSGQAMAALRIGLCRLVLWPEAPGRDAVVAIATAQGGFVLEHAPPSRMSDQPSPRGRRVMGS